MVHDKMQRGDGCVETQKRLSNLPVMIAEDEWLASDEEAVSAPMENRDRIKMEAQRRNVRVRLKLITDGIS